MVVLLRTATRVLCLWYFLVEPHFLLDFFQRVLDFFPGSVVFGKEGRKEGSKQGSKQASKQESKEARKQARKQASKEGSKQGSKQAS